MTYNVSSGTLNSTIPVIPASSYGEYFGQKIFTLLKNVCGCTQLLDLLYLVLELYLSTDFKYSYLYLYLHLKYW